MRKPVLLIDMDCILADLLPYWLDIYNKESGENVSPRDIIEYNIANFVKNPDLFLEILHRKDFFTNVKPMPGAVKYMRKLIDEGFDVIVATQPPRNSAYAVKEKTDWLQKYIPQYDVSNIIFCHRKELISGDVLFDDKPDHLIAWKNNHPKGKTATIKYCYNKDVLVDACFINQKNAWKEFYEFVRMLNIF